jgi:predicted RecB family nuclease
LINHVNKMENKKVLKICVNGHQFYKSSICPVCPTCENNRLSKDDFLSHMSAPARRALESNGIKTIAILAQFSEKEVLKFHGMGKSTIPKLKQFLADQNLGFKIELVEQKDFNQEKKIMIFNEKLQNGFIITNII